MNRIMYVDLKEGTITYRARDNTSLNDYGRGLASSLLQEHVPLRADYFGDDNAIVVTPGLLSGTVMPSTGRLTVSTKGISGIRTVNIAGPISPKLASIGVSGIVVRGTSPGRRPAVLVLNGDEAHVEVYGDLSHSPVTETIHLLRRKWGHDAAVIGIGPTGERMMALSTIFGTYPPGEPEYHAVRRGSGDVFGAKGLKAIVVATPHEYGAEVADKVTLTRKAKLLASIIRDHPVCGKALPAYGSITLMEMLKNGGRVPDVPAPVKPVGKTRRPAAGVGQINRACNTNCAIGCLNRDQGDSEFTFSSPFDSEAFAACRNLAGIEDAPFVVDINRRCFDLGLDSIEFIATAAMMLKIQQESDFRTGLRRLLDEISAATPIGRIVGSTSRGIYSLYREHEPVRAMVTQAATTESERFAMKMPFRVAGTEAIGDLDYLYAYMLASGSIGLCLFTVFAILDNEVALTALADIIAAKIGRPVAAAEIITSGYELLGRERDYERQCLNAGLVDNIPEFVKVLYRYYGREK